MLRVVEQAAAGRARASRGTAVPTSRGRVVSGRAGPWAVELGPTVAVVALIWVKLVSIGLLLPSISWAGAEPPHPLAALRAYPDMLSATLAALLLPLSLLLLLPRVARLAALVVLNLAIS